MRQHPKRPQSFNHQVEAVEQPAMCSIRAYVSNPNRSLTVSAEPVLVGRQCVPKAEIGLITSRQCARDDV